MKQVSVANQHRILDCAGHRVTVFIVPLIDLDEEHPAAVIVWGKSTECGVFFNVVQVAETRHLVLHLVPEACLVETPASGVQRACTSDKYGIVRL
jgi:hypothetical protein